MDLSLENKQSLALSPQGILSMKVLQMNGAQLAEYVEQAWMENPMLEMKQGSGSVPAVTSEKLVWLEKKSQIGMAHATREDDDWKPELSSPADMESLYDHLKSQLQAKKLPSHLAKACHFVVASLNPKGWLDEDVSRLAQMAGCPKEDMAQAVAQVQSLHPAGVGARDLGQCLALQLREVAPENTLAVTLVMEYLEPLAKGYFPAIAKACQVSVAQVQKAMAVIRTLNPNPAGEFAVAQVAPAANPDVFLDWDGEQWHIALESSMPRLCLSPFYAQLAQEEDPVTREYLESRMEQATHIIGAIVQRQENLVACTRQLLALQGEFFAQGPGHLVPLDMATMAGHMDVHLSTVSRIASSKYLQCPYGLFPFSYFFSKKTGDTGVSSEKVKHMLQEMILAENREKPLSDQKLCEMLAETGITISRRAVTKYRESLGILSGMARKTTGST